MKKSVLLALMVILVLIPCICHVTAHEFDYDGAHWTDCGSCTQSPDLGCACHRPDDCDCDWPCGCILTCQYVSDPIAAHDTNHGFNETIHPNDGYDNDCNGVIDDRNCNGKDDDYDGYIDEDPGGCLVKFLFIGAGWTSGDTVFQNTVDEFIADWEANLSLSSCQDRINATVIKPSVFTLTAPPCGFPNPWYIDAKNYLLNLNPSIKIEDINVVVYLLDQDLCNDEGQYIRINGGYGELYVEISPPSGIGEASGTFMHEFGHGYNLHEEYCVQGRPWSGGGLCNKPAAPNYLSTQYGCDPNSFFNQFHGGFTSTQCCWPDAKGDIWCNGNDAVTSGGSQSKCVMSYTGNPYTPRGYCQLCLNQMTNPPAGNIVTVDRPNGLIPLRCDFVNPLGLRNLMVAFLSVSDSGALSIDSLDVTPGRPTLGGLGTTGEYSILIKVNGFPILQNFFDLSCSDCIQTTGNGGGDPYEISFKGIIPDSVTDQNILTLILTKDGVPIGQTTLNGNPPIANAGPDQCVGATASGGTGAMVTVDGSGSRDPDGDTLTYSWSAPGITFTDPTAAKTEAFFPLGSTTVTLSVSDGSGTPAQVDTVKIAVKNAGTINGYKFEDNLNGTQTPLKNWQIILKNATDGSIVGTSITNSNGKFSFSNLSYGIYLLEEIPQVGWIQSKPNVTVDLNCSIHKIVYNFTNYPISIRGYKIDRTTGLGLSGWTITLKNGTKTLTKVTDSSGFYEFADLRYGTFTLNETRKSGWTDFTWIQFGENTRVVDINSSIPALTNQNFTNAIVPNENWVGRGWICGSNGKQAASFSFQAVNNKGVISGFMSYMDLLTNMKLSGTVTKLDVNRATHTAVFGGTATIGTKKYPYMAKTISGRPGYFEISINSPLFRYFKSNNLCGGTISSS